MGKVSFNDFKGRLQGASKCLTTLVKHLLKLMLVITYILIIFDLKKAWLLVTWSQFEFNLTPLIFSTGQISITSLRHLKWAYVLDKIIKWNLNFAGIQIFVTFYIIKPSSLFVQGDPSEFSREEGKYVDCFWSLSRMTLFSPCPHCQAHIRSLVNGREPKLC